MAAALQLEMCSTFCPSTRFDWILPEFASSGAPISLDLLDLFLCPHCVVFLCLPSLLQVTNGSQRRVRQGGGWQGTSIPRSVSPSLIRFHRCVNLGLCRNRWTACWRRSIWMVMYSLTSLRMGRLLPRYLCYYFPLFFLRVSDANGTQDFVIPMIGLSGEWHRSASQLSAE
jgi:hypothetical protein